MAFGDPNLGVEHKPTKKRAPKRTPKVKKPPQPLDYQAFTQERDSQALIKAPVKQVPQEKSEAKPICAKPNTYYWANFYGEKEIVLTTASGKHFYLHGDEYTRKIENITLVKEICERTPIKPT